VGAGAAAGERNGLLARRLACTPKTVRKWRGRWAAAAPRLLAAEGAPAALADAPRSGAPATFTAAQIVRIIDLAGRPPEQCGRPVDAWTPRELADEAVKQGLVAAISPRSGERFLGRGRPPAPSESLLAHREDQG
jgi:hypothetical protein